MRKSQRLFLWFYDPSHKRWLSVFITGRLKENFTHFPPLSFILNPSVCHWYKIKKKCFASVWTFLRMLSGSERKQTIGWKFRLSATLFAMFGFSSDSGSCQEKLPRFCWPPTSDRSGTSKLIMLLIIQKPLHLARVFFALGLDDEGKSSVCLLVLKQR